MIQRVLIANRGEIAVRIARTCRRLGIGTVAVFSDADAGALHVAACDTAMRLPGTASADTYLRADLLVDAARRTGADAVHPGYGFLAESGDFARAVEAAELTWIGPPAVAIDAMGAKVVAKELVARAGVPVLPDSTTVDVEQLPLPVLVKASAGGGGRGMRAVERAEDLPDAIAAARREAESAFGDGSVFVERLVRRARHVEIQVFADTHGNVVSLHERECSIQRRHQKIIEEAPSPAVDAELRARLGAAAVEAARSVGYLGAGTVEFLLEPDGQFWFLEMNTRLQVEHPVTELVTGLDLVELQLAVAAGQPLPPAALEPALVGHAIEARLTAEEPAAGYRPASGRFTTFEIPDLDGAVRVDSGVASGSMVPPHYDSMVTKVIVHASTRDGAARALAAALERARLHGPVTNRDQLVRVLRHAAFLAGDLHTGFLDDHPCTEPIEGDVEAAAVAVAMAEQAANRAAARVWAELPAGWRNNPAVDQSITLGRGESTVAVSYRMGHQPYIVVTESAECGSGARKLPPEQQSAAHGRRVDLAVVEATPERVVIERDGVRRTFGVARDGAVRHVDAEDGHVTFVVIPRHPEPDAELAAGSLVAPMPGVVLRVLVGIGDEVDAGQPLVVVEAMKMEHQVQAPGGGVVAELLVRQGDQVETGQVLLRLEEARSDDA
ncbi:biotin carboxylase N-terminal domain-containing protein [soil metagenome]